MTHTPHELDEVFPDHTAAIDRLKQDEPHFRNLAEAYHVLNRGIHRAETDLEPVADHTLEEMKKRRLAMLDEIRGMLAGA